MIIVIFGLPGTGKTTLAEALASKIKAKVISSDKIRKELNLEGNYSEKAKKSVYKRIATEALETDSDHVVLDATFNKIKYRSCLENHFNKNNIFYVELKAPENRIKERMEKSRKYSEADFRIYKKLESEFEPLQEDHLILNTEKNVETAVNEIIRYLKDSV